MPNQINIDLTELFNSWMLLFCLGIYVITYAVRITAHAALHKYTPEQFYWYREWLVPITPIIAGVLVGRYLTQFPYPDKLTTRGGHELYGLVAGFLSAYAYRFVMAFVRKTWPGVLPQKSGAE